MSLAQEVDVTKQQPAILYQLAWALHLRDADEAAVRLLLEHPERAREMGRAARASAVARFSPAARMDDYLDLYRSPK